MATTRHSDLPARPVFWTLDQVASMLQVDLEYFKRRLVFYEGKSAGMDATKMFRAIDVSAPQDVPAWRIHSDEIIRWCKVRNVRIYGYK